MPVLSQDDITIRVQTQGDTKGVKDYENALSSMGHTGEKTGGSFLKLTGAVAAGEAAFNLARGAIGQLTGFVKDSVNAFEESQNMIAQTNTVLASTNHAAGLAGYQITLLANQLEKLTKYSDEDVRSVENMLLTFTSIKADVFPQATKTVLDMATALGEDTKSASIQLGKALQDPINGITALRRVGVNFSDAQKQVIQKLVDTGKTAQAQKLILKELQTEFGGSAEAAGKTFAGSLAKLKNQFDDVQEIIGMTITDRMAPFISKAAEALSAIDWESVMDKLANSFDKYWKGLENITASFIKVAVKIEQFLKPSFVALWHTIEYEVIPTLEKLWHNVIEPLLPIVGGVLVVALKVLIDTFNFLLQAVTPLIDYLADHKIVIESLAAAFVILKGTMMLTDAFNAMTIGFETLRLVTIPSFMASMETMNAFLMGFGGFGVIAAAAAIAFIAIQQSAKDTMKVLDDTMKAIDQATTSEGEAIKSVENAYKAGKISKQQEMVQIDKITGNNNIPHHAGGGPVIGGQPVLVGDGGGPEIFVPNQSGNIKSTRESQNMMGGRNIHIGQVVIQTPAAAQEFFRQLDRETFLAGKGLSISQGAF